MTSSTEIARRDPTSVMSRIGELSLPEAFTESYPAFDADAGLVEAVVENMDGEGIPINSLPQVTIPLGGGQSWTIVDPFAEGGEVTVRKLTGIVMAKRNRRAFWPSTQITGDPPTCVSVDGKTGQGAYGPGSEANPGGSCKSCPMAQWGTRRSIGGPAESNAQACSQFKTILLLPPGSALPLRVKAPATSLKPIDDYMMALGTKGVRYHSVELSLSLVRVDGANPYSVIKPEISRRLEPEEAQATKIFADMIAAMLDDVDSVAQEAGAGMTDLGEGVSVGEAPGTATAAPVESEDGEVLDEEFGNQEATSKAKR